MQSTISPELEPSVELRGLQKTICSKKSSAVIVRVQRTAAVPLYAVYPSLLTPFPLPPSSPHSSQLAMELN